MQPLSTSSILATTSDVYPNFKLKTTISTIFLEHDKHILVLMRCLKEDQPSTWGVPGGKAEHNESPKETLYRELREETQIDISNEKVEYHGHRFARIPGWDYIVHLYHAVLKDRPVVQLDPKEHVKYEWVSMYAFKTLPLLKGQDEAFDIVYRDRLWQLVKPEHNPTVEKIESLGKSIILSKGDRKLAFDARKRLILNLIGTSGSGKGTQGELLSQMYGIPSISAGDLFRDEFRAGSKLGWMISQFDKEHYPAYLPDEVPVGMMTKRIAENDCDSGFILDGFPRTQVQADVTREVILRDNDLHIPLFMDVPESEIWERLPGRSICPDCGHQVRKFDENPTPGFCPIESQKGIMVKLEQRPEDIDRIKTQRRLKMFSDNRDIILEAMNQRDPVATFKLDNTIPPREVFHQLSTYVQDKLNEQYKSENN